MEAESSTKFLAVAVPIMGDWATTTIGLGFGLREGNSLVPTTIMGMLFLKIAVITTLGLSLFFLPWPKRWLQGISLGFTGICYWNIIRIGTSL